jgi:hypothetical protein
MHQPFQTFERYSNIPQIENVIRIVNNGSFIIAETKELKKLTSIDM